MSKWRQHAEKQKSRGGETTPNLTMNLRCVLKRDKTQVIEQLVEYRNSNGMVVTTEWVEIPVIFEE